MPVYHILHSNRHCESNLRRKGCDNQLVVCDAENGTTYTATQVTTECLPYERQFRDAVSKGQVNSGKLVYFQEAGCKDVFDPDRLPPDFTPQECNNVLKAYASYTPTPAPQPRNRVKKFATGVSRNEGIAGLLNPKEEAKFFCKALGGRGY